MTRARSEPHRPDENGRAGIAFLLTQLGTRAAARFAERVAELDLTPPLVGLMRAVALTPGSSQRDVGTRLGLAPSRVVAFVDELEDRRLLARVRSDTDRRQYALELTDDGETMMRRIAEIAQAHEDEICASMPADERTVLMRSLGRLAAAHNLSPGIHPGYRTL